jgi:hypothetical protein
MTEAIDAAIRRGLAYLERTQRPSGEFATFTGPRLNLAGAERYPKSVYVTTFVIHALAQLPAEPQIAAIQRRAADFIAGEREQDGAWNYEGRGEWRVPCDLDDTSCAVAALAMLGQRPDLSFYALLWQNEAAPGGPYYTWLGINDRADFAYARQVDALVNANLLFCCGLLGLELPGAAAYLERVVRDEAYSDQSAYTVSPHFLIYAISRAYADGGVGALALALPALQRYLLTRLAPPQAEPSALNLACVAAGLLNSGVDRGIAAPYLEALLGAQQGDGGWPAWAAYAGFAPNYDGAPALTTALALEALGKYLRRG